MKIAYGSLDQRSKHALGRMSKTMYIITCEHSSDGSSKFVRFEFDR